MGWKLFGYGGHPGVEKLPEKGKRTLKALIVDLFKPKCFWLEEICDTEDRNNDLKEEQHLNLRKWLTRISEKDSPARFPAIVAGEDGGFSPEIRDRFSLDSLMRIHEGGNGKLIVSPLRRSESREKKRVRFRFPIESIIVYSPDFDLHGENSK